MCRWGNGSLDRGDVSRVLNQLQKLPQLGRALSDLAYLSYLACLSFTRMPEGQKYLESQR